MGNYYYGNERPCLRWETDENHPTNYIYVLFKGHTSFIGSLKITSEAMFWALDYYRAYGEIPKNERKYSEYITSSGRLRFVENLGFWFRHEWRYNSMKRRDKYEILNQCELDAHIYMEMVHDFNRENYRRLYDDYFFEIERYFDSFNFLEPCTDAELASKKAEYMIKYNSILMGYNDIANIPNYYELIQQVPGTYTVYCHTSPSNKKYIGITKNPVNFRWENGEGYAKQKKFYNAIKKHKWENFKHEILAENVNGDTAAQLERYYIAKFNSIAKGYNVNFGGFQSCRKVTISALADVVRQYSDS